MFSRRSTRRPGRARGRRGSLQRQRHIQYSALARPWHANAASFLVGDDVLSRSARPSSHCPAGLRIYRVSAMSKQVLNFGTIHGAHLCSLHAVARHCGPIRPLHGCLRNRQSPAPDHRKFNTACVVLYSCSFLPVDMNNLIALGALVVL